jgi:hypothetical protein
VHPKGRQGAYLIKAPRLEESPYLVVLEQRLPTLSWQSHELEPFASGPSKNACGRSSRVANLRGAESLNHGREVSIAKKLKRQHVSENIKGKAAYEIQDEPIVLKVESGYREVFDLSDSRVCAIATDEVGSSDEELVSVTMVRKGTRRGQHICPSGAPAIYALFDATRLVCCCVAEAGFYATRSLLHVAQGCR